MLEHLEPCATCGAEPVRDKYVGGIPRWNISWMHYTIACPSGHDAIDYVRPVVAACRWNLRQRSRSFPAASSERKTTDA